MVVGRLIPSSAVPVWSLSRTQYQIFGHVVTYGSGSQVTRVVMNQLTGEALCGLGNPFIQYQISDDPHDCILQELKFGEDFGCGYRVYLRAAVGLNMSEDDIFGVSLKGTMGQERFSAGLKFRSETGWYLQRMEEDWKLIDESPQRYRGEVLELVLGVDTSSCQYTAIKIGGYYTQYTPGYVYCFAEPYYDSPYLAVYLDLYHGSADAQPSAVQLYDLELYIDTTAPTYVGPKMPW